MHYALDRVVNPLDLMRLYIETANRLDDLGRLLETNDGLQSPAPRFFYGSTSLGYCWYFGHRIEQTIAERLTALLENENHAYDPNKPISLDCYEELLNCLSSDASQLRIETGPFYWYPNVTEVSGSTELLDKADQHRLVEELESWRDALGFYCPTAASLDCQEVAAICSSVRKRPVAHIAGCETSVRFRGQGHAKKAVARWVNAVQALNAVPFYNTSWANTASQKVAIATNAAQFAVGIAIY